MRSIAVLALISVGACNNGGDPNTHTDAAHVDAPANATTSCANPIPTSATPTVLISGVVTDGAFGGSANPLVGATVDAFRTGSASLGTATTESGGIYQVTATTGDLPVDDMRLTDATYEDTRYFPRAPIAQAISLPRLPLFTTTEVAQFPATFGVTQDAGKGMAIVLVADCQATATTNAMVTVSPPGSAVVKYLHADQSTTGTATDSIGVAFIFNLSASASIGATVGSTVYHAHGITADPSYLAIATVSEQ